MDGQPNTQTLTITWTHIFSMWVKIEAVCHQDGQNWGRVGEGISAWQTVFCSAKQQYTYMCCVTNFGASLHGSINKPSVDIVFSVLIGYVSFILLFLMLSLESETCALMSWQKSLTFLKNLNGWCRYKRLTLALGPTPHDIYKKNKCSDESHWTVLCTFTFPLILLP